MKTATSHKRDAWLILINLVAGWLIYWFWFKPNLGIEYWFVAFMQPRYSASSFSLAQFTGGGGTRTRHRGRNLLKWSKRHPLIASPGGGSFGFQPLCCL